jgi:hypothetical protein
MSERDSTSVWSYFSQAEEIIFRNDQPFSEEPRGRPCWRRGESDIHDQSMYGLLRDSVVAYDLFGKEPEPELEHVSGNDTDAATLVSVASVSVSQASTVGLRVHFACLEKDMGRNFERISSTSDNADVVSTEETHKRFSGRSRAPSPYPRACSEGARKPSSLRAKFSQARLDVKVRCRSLAERFGKLA